MKENTRKQQSLPLNIKGSALNGFDNEKKKSHQPQSDAASINLNSPDEASIFHIIHFFEGG